MEGTQGHLFPLLDEGGPSMANHHARLMTLAELDLTALLDLNRGMPMFVTARHTDFLIAEGLATRGLDGRPVLTGEGQRLIEGTAMARPSPG
jgi:hypothetical protein